MDMNNLERQLPADLVALIKTDPHAAEAVKKYVDVARRHHTNPLYLEAREAFRNTQLGQIDKGAGKYPEPLNADSWTIDELVDHNLMELVDAIHYIVGIRVKGRAMARNLKTALEMVESDDQEKREFGADLIREVIKGL